jgi:serine O-acetyltransferase
VSRDPDLAADMARYPKRALLREQSAWAILVYRWGRRIENSKPGLFKNFRNRIYWPIFRIVETFTGISLPKNCRIGPGLRIYHFGTIFVHGNAVLGANCTLRQGVTIGNRGLDGPTPTIEDDVDFGAFAQVLGNVRIGRGARIGAMSVVLCDVPAGATAVGVPARIIPAKTPSQPVSSG